MTRRISKRNHQRRRRARQDAIVEAIRALQLDPVYLNYYQCVNCFNTWRVGNAQHPSYVTLCPQCMLSAVPFQSKQIFP